MILELLPRLYRVLEWQRKAVYTKIAIPSTERVMPDQTENGVTKEVGKRTGRDPVILAAAGSVLLAWYQYYVRGNKEHGLFIGLWPPTLLAFSNAVRINEIAETIDSNTSSLFEWLSLN